MAKNDQIKRAIELCLAVYRVTERFPRGEVLRQKLRGLSLDTVENLVYNLSAPTVGRFFNYEKLYDNFKSLFVRLLIAEKQGWVHPRNLYILRQSYKSLYDKVKSIEADNLRKKIQNMADANVFQGMSERQKRITAFLRGQPYGATMEEIATDSKLSKRTVSRELKPLIVSKAVRRSGKTKGAKFLLN